MRIARLNADNNRRPTSSAEADALPSLWTGTVSGGVISVGGGYAGGGAAEEGDNEMLQ